MPLIKEVLGEVVICLSRGTGAHLLRIEQTHVDQTTFAQKSHREAIRDELVHLVLILAGVLRWVPKVTLNLRNHRAHCREKWS